MGAKTTWDRVDEVAAAMRELGTRHILITPGGSVGTQVLPLYTVAADFIFIRNWEREKGEVYPITGRADLGVGKVVLDQIAAAIGLRTISDLCGQVDDRSDPYRVEYQVGGTVLQLDGTERPLSAVKRIDLRANREAPVDTWGADAQEIARIAARPDREGRTRDPWPQILAARMHILSFAASKAHNRMVRLLGVRTSYSRDELARGFAVLRLQFTGRHPDPEVERAVAMAIAGRALRATSALYGATAAGLRLPAPAAVPRLAAAPAHDDADEPLLTGHEEPNGAQPAAQPAVPTDSGADAAARRLLAVVQDHVDGAMDHAELLLRRAAEAEAAKAATPEPTGVYVGEDGWQIPEEAPPATPQLPPHPEDDWEIPISKGVRALMSAQTPERLRQWADWAEGRLRKGVDERYRATNEKQIKLARAWAAYLAAGGQP